MKLRPAFLYQEQNQSLNSSFSSRPDDFNLPHAMQAKFIHLYTFMYLPAAIHESPDIVQISTFLMYSPRYFLGRAIAHSDYLAGISVGQTQSQQQC